MNKSLKYGSLLSTAALVLCLGTPLVGGAKAAVVEITEPADFVEDTRKAYEVYKALGVRTVSERFLEAKVEFLGKFEYSVENLEARVQENEATLSEFKAKVEEFEEAAETTRKIEELLSFAYNQENLKAAFEYYKATYLNEDGTNSYVVDFAAKEKTRADAAEELGTAESTLTGAGIAFTDARIALAEEKYALDKFTFTKNKILNSITSYEKSKVAAKFSSGGDYGVLYDAIDGYQSGLKDIPLATVSDISAGIEEVIKAASFPSTANPPAVYAELTAYKNAKDTVDTAKKAYLAKAASWAEVADTVPGHETIGSYAQELGFTNLDATDPSKYAPVNEANIQSEFTSFAAVIGFNDSIAPWQATRPLSWKESDNHGESYTATTGTSYHDRATLKGELDTALGKGVMGAFHPSSNTYPVVTWEHRDSSNTLLTYDSATAGQGKTWEERRSAAASGAWGQDPNFRLHAGTKTDGTHFDYTYAFNFRYSHRAFTGDDLLATDSPLYINSNVAWGHASAEEHTLNFVLAVEEAIDTDRNPATSNWLSGSHHIASGGNDKVATNVLVEVLIVQNLWSHFVKWANLRKAIYTNDKRVRDAVKAYYEAGERASSQIAAALAFPTIDDTTTVDDALNGYETVKTNFGLLRDYVIDTPASSGVLGVTQALSELTRLKSAVDAATPDLTSAVQTLLTFLRDTTNSDKLEELLQRANVDNPDASITELRRLVFNLNEAATSIGEYKTAIIDAVQGTENGDLRVLLGFGRDQTLDTDDINAIIEKVAQLKGATNDHTDLDAKKTKIQNEVADLNELITNYLSATDNQDAVLADDSAITALKNALNDETSSASISARFANVLNVPGKEEEVNTAEGELTAAKRDKKEKEDALSASIVAKFAFTRNSFYNILKDPSVSLTNLLAEMDGLATSLNELAKKLNADSLVSSDAALKTAIESGVHGTVKSDLIRAVSSSALKAMLGTLTLQELAYLGVKEWATGAQAAEGETQVVTEGSDGALSGYIVPEDVSKRFKTLLLLQAMATHSGAVADSEANADLLAARAGIVRGLVNNLEDDVNLEKAMLAFAPMVEFSLLNNVWEAIPNGSTSADFGAGSEVTYSFFTEGLKANLASANLSAHYRYKLFNVGVALNYAETEAVVREAVAAGTDPVTAAVEKVSLSNDFLTGIINLGYYEEDGLRSGIYLAVGGGVKTSEVSRQTVGTGVNLEYSFKFNNLENVEGFFSEFRPIARLDFGVITQNKPADGNVSKDKIFLNGNLQGGFKLKVGMKDVGHGIGFNFAVPMSASTSFFHDSTDEGKKAEAIRRVKLGLEFNLNYTDLIKVNVGYCAEINSYYVANSLKTSVVFNF